MKHSFFYDLESKKKEAISLDSTVKFKKNKIFLFKIQNTQKSQNFSSASTAEGMILAPSAAFALIVGFSGLQHLHFAGYLPLFCALSLKYLFSFSSSPGAL